MKIPHGLKGFVSSLINEESFLNYFRDESEEYETKKNKLEFIHSRKIFLLERVNYEISSINGEIDEIEKMKGSIEPNHFLLKKCDLLFKFSENLKEEIMVIENYENILEENRF